MGFLFYFFVIVVVSGGVFLWLEEGGCLYFLFCCSKSFRMLMLYKAYKYDPVGSFQMLLILYKEAVRKTC